MQAVNKAVPYTLEYRINEGGWVGPIGELGKSSENNNWEGWNKWGGVENRTHAYYEELLRKAD